MQTDQRGWGARIQSLWPETLPRQVDRMGRSYPEGSTDSYEVRKRFSGRRQISLQALTSIKPWLDRGVGRQSKPPTPQPVMQLLTNGRPVQRLSPIEHPQAMLTLREVEVDIKPTPTGENPV